MGAEQGRSCTHEVLHLCLYPDRSILSLLRYVQRVNYISVPSIPNIIAEVSENGCPTERSTADRLACGHVFCDTCTTYRRVVPWIDTEKPVRVCSTCYGHPKPRPPSSIPIPTPSSLESQKQSSQKSSENGSSGDSTSTVSSGEHLNDLCLSPTDIFDIEQPGAGNEEFLATGVFEHSSCPGPVIVDIPATRRVYETVKSGLEKIGANYPIGKNSSPAGNIEEITLIRIELIKESTRPSYWRPDHECPACYICKRTFNSTTNRLHHW